MPTQFTMLASGSSGNCALLQSEGFGLLIDCGLPARTLAARLAVVGAKFPVISAAMITHIHSDHWNRSVFSQFRQHQIPLFVHPSHAEFFSQESDEFRALQHAGLVRLFSVTVPLQLAPHLTGLPILLPHDAEPTFAFRIEGTDLENGHNWSLGYLADLGHTTPELVDLFHAVDILALEYNHDVQMERRSGRPQHLIRRVLGPMGHLSNLQAANFSQAILDRRGGIPFQAIVQLHLSRHCNTPQLAIQAAQKILQPYEGQTLLVTATQDQPSRTMSLVGRPLPKFVPRITKPRVSYQPCLPGME